MKRTLAVVAVVLAGCQAAAEPASPSIGLATTTPRTVTASANGPTTATPTVTGPCIDHDVLDEHRATSADHFDDAVTAVARHDIPAAETAARLAAADFRAVGDDVGSADPVSRQHFLRAAAALDDAAAALRDLDTTAAETWFLAAANEVTVATAGMSAARYC